MFKAQIRFFVVVVSNVRLTMSSPAASYMVSKVLIRAYLALARVFGKYIDGKMWTENVILSSARTCPVCPISNHFWCSNDQFVSVIRDWIDHSIDKVHYESLGLFIEFHFTSIFSDGMEAIKFEMLYIRMNKQWKFHIWNDSLLLWKYTRWQKSNSNERLISCWNNA